MENIAKKNKKKKEKPKWAYTEKATLKFFVNSQI